MKVFIERSNKTVKIMFHGKVKNLLKNLNLNSETVLVTKNNILVTEEDNVKNTDNINISSVISGG